MTQRNMARQGLLVFGLIVGIVGGNFVLHRWMLGNSTSREADAGTIAPSLSQEDLDEFAPRPRLAQTPLDPAMHRERLRKLISQKLPDASADELDSWVEELADVSLPMAEGILDLRGQVGALPAIDASTDREPASEDQRVFNFSRGITR